MLSPREKQVAARLAMGKSFGEISHELGISIHTVKSYVARAKRKNNCDTTVGLAVKFAVSEALSSQ